MDYNLLISREKEKKFLLIGIFKDFTSRAQCEEWLIRQPCDTSLIAKINLFIKWSCPEELRELLNHGKQILITETTNLVPACILIGAITHDYPLIIKKK